MPTIDLGSVVGPQGAQGNTGPQGPQGVAGPSLITSATETTLTGVLAGDSGTVGVRAVDDAVTSLSPNLITSGAVYRDCAPSGYGLGEVVYDLTTISDTESVSKSGLYRVESTTSHMPGSFNGVLSAVVYSSNYIFLALIVNSNSTKVIYTRVKQNGTWKAWERTTPPVLHVSFGSVTGTGATTATRYSDFITDQYVLLRHEFGTPSAIVGNITVTTNAGSVQIQGNIVGSTTVDLWLIKSTDLTVTTT